MSGRVRIKTHQVELEFEGSEDFLTAQLNSLSDLLQTLGKTPAAPVAPTDVMSPDDHGLPPVSLGEAEVVVPDPGSSGTFLRNAQPHSIPAPNDSDMSTFQLKRPVTDS